MPDPSQLFQEAADLHLKGKLAAAEEAYLRLLAAQPDHFDARHLLGVLQQQQGRSPEALASIGAALETNPDFPPALLNYAVVLRALGRLPEALAGFDRALAIKPDYAEALYNRGLALIDLDRALEALASFDKALAIRPDYLEALVSRGNTLGKLGRAAEALASFEAALALRADHVEALIQRGRALRRLNRPADALASIERALAIRPNNPDALIHRGNALQDLQRPQEALSSFDQALDVRPGDGDALINRGNALRNLNRPAEALLSYDRALGLRPDHAGTHYNRGNALLDLKRPAESLASFDRALAIDPLYVDALNNRAGALRALRRPAEALASFDRALAIAPDDAETHLNRACARLLLGDFERGLAEYEWRWKTPHAARFRRDFAQPLWLGEVALEGRTILLHAEQGLGDAIQFVRFAPLVAARAGKVVLEVQTPLKSLLCGLEGVSLVVGKGESLPAFDCHCPLASLPLAFKTTLATIPANVPYLSATPDRVGKWRERLPQSPLPRVGIAWAGNPAFKGDRDRSIGLPRLQPLLSAPGVEFFSLQKDLRPGDREALRDHPAVIHLGDAIEDFSDTAAIVSLLDLVISSDTSIVHLAGAMGKPVWILLQCAADWRWLVERADSPWYPTARLFRQPVIDDWESVLRQVEAELATLPKGPARS
jgi:tetratricopeptide (TPR) repeat protein